MENYNMNEMFQEMGVLLLLDSPEGIELGIDNTSWKTGNKFKGIQLIPHGVHFVYYALQDQNYQFKIGFFLDINPKNLIQVRKWSPQFEDFLKIDEDQESRMITAVKQMEFDVFLGPYPLEQHNVWLEVSNCLTSATLDRLNPIERKIYRAQDQYDITQQEKIQTQKLKDALTDLYGDQFNEQIEEEAQVQNIQEDGCEDNMEDQDEQGEQDEGAQKDKQGKSATQNKQNGKNQKNETLNSTENLMKPESQPSQSNQKKIEKQARKKEKENQQKEFHQKGQKQDFQSLAGTIYYTDIPQRKVMHGFIGANLTKLNFDKSEILKEILKKSFAMNYREFFAEFQYSFISFFLGENLASLEQWKEIFIILCNCQSYIQQNQELFINFIPILYGMLRQFPKDFFIDIITQNSFLKTTLNSFIELCQNEKASKQLKLRVQQLTELLQNQFLFFPKTNEILFNQHGQAVIDEDDQDAPTIVQDVNDFYKFD